MLAARTPHVVPCDQVNQTKHKKKKLNFPFLLHLGSCFYFMGIVNESCQWHSLLNVSPSQSEPSWNQTTSPASWARTHALWEGSHPSLLTRPVKFLVAHLGAALMLPLLSYLSSGVDWTWPHDGYAVTKLQIEETQETQVLSKVPWKTRDIYVSTLLITQTFNTIWSDLMALQKHIKQFFCVVATFKPTVFTTQ